MAKITDRELEVLILTAKGFTSNTIAKELSIGKRTVDEYKDRMLIKLNVHTLIEVIVYAIKNGLIDVNKL